MSTAADRIQAFLDERAPVLGLDPQIIIAMNGVELTVDDLEAVLIHAPKTVHCQKCGLVVSYGSQHLVGGRSPGWTCKR